MRTLRDALSGLVFRYMPAGGMPAGLSPGSGWRTFSRTQPGHQSRLAEASRYAQFAAQVQPVYAELARGTRQTAHALALSDWLSPPVIHQIEWSEGKIRVQARDNVLVTRVRLTVLDEAGQLLEQGEAVRGEGDWWEFATTAAGAMLIAEAWDLPGYVTRLII